MGGNYCWTRLAMCV